MSDPASPDDTGRAARRPLLVRLPRGAIVAPASCACCSGVASDRVAVHGPGELLVGYCGVCREHVARASTRRLAAVLSAALLGTSFAVALPIAAPALSVYECLALVVIAAAAPLLANALVSRRPQGHASLGPAVWFQSRTELAAANHRWAAELSATTGGEVLGSALRHGLRAGELAVVGCAAAASVLLHSHYHPRVRVLNLNENPIIVSVDGGPLGRVEPTAAESPEAGLSTRVPAGRRELTALDIEGREVARAMVHVVPGQEHLFAPGAPEICFWLERRAYGRAKPEIDFHRLEGEQRFWVIPDQVLGWFVPSAPPQEGARTTGGTTTVLRQGRCDELPNPAEDDGGSR